MKPNLYALSLCIFHASSAFAADELCVAVSDTALFADAKLVSYSPIFGQISGVFKLLPAPADRFHCC
jgi:hypothetical protein